MLHPGMYKEDDNPRYRFGFNGMMRDDDMMDKSYYADRELSRKLK
jgi:hypothetical protein